MINHELTITKSLASLAEISALDNQLRAALGMNISGITHREDQLRIHFLTNVGGNDDLAQAVVAAHNALEVTTDKQQITADDTDTATITCSDAAISGDANLDYEVYGSDGQLDASGTVAVSGGVASLPFTAPLADTYLVRLARQGAGNYEDGYIQIEAV